MNDLEAEPAFELDALLDSGRLAAAWQISHDRAPIRTAAAEIREPGERDGADPDRADDTAEMPAVAGPEPEPIVAQPALPVAALPMAVAHRALLDELERVIAGSPGFAAKARRVLAAPLAQLAQVIDPLDAGAAEAVLDDLEDVFQALLSATGWPGRGEE
jgi:hypothetical protein